MDGYVLRPATGKVDEALKKIEASHTGKDALYTSLTAVHAKNGDVNQTELWLACLGRTSQHETIAGRLCDAVGGVAAASG